MPTLRRIWLEVCLALAGIVLLTGGGGLVPPEPPIVRGGGNAHQPLWATGNLLDHARAFAIRNGGYPDSFNPVQQFLLDMGLPKAPAYWECAASIPMPEIEKELQFVLGRYSGVPEDQERLVTELGRRFLRRPGDFVYVPLRRLELEAWQLGADDTLFEDCLFVMYPYPVDDYESREIQESSWFISTVDATRVGPYELVRTRQRLPPTIWKRVSHGNGQETVVQQRGTHLTIQTTPPGGTP